MQLYKLLKREFEQNPRRLLIISSIAGIANALMIAVINSASETVANNDLNWRHSLMFILLLGIFYITTKYTLDRSSELIESVIARIRQRLVNKVRHTELSTLEKYGSATIYARISNDTLTISNLSTRIIKGCQDSLMVFFTLLYVAYVSLWSFFVIVTGLVIGVLYFLSHNEIFKDFVRRISLKETYFFEKIEYQFESFKEIKINWRKNEEVFQDFVKTNNELRDERTVGSKHYNVTLTFSVIFFYVIMGVILFVMPKLHAEHSETIIKVVAATLFIAGPLESLIFTVPHYINATNAADNILKLESQLEEELRHLSEQKSNEESPWVTVPFHSSIELKNLSYQYPAINGTDESFQVGPLDLNIHKGELIFVTGGNGSGKTTFLNLFTGLYKPKTGKIKVDSHNGHAGTTVSFRNYQQYQNLFTTIFSDYHLFDKLYGIEGEIDPDHVNALLQKLGLPPEKTEYVNGKFTSIKLSSGQKKRLALTRAIMEDKEIYIFDEVAADLDPAFRDVFYFEILPELKGRNKTLIVVSHDQQYWMVADRLWHFQDGSMRELTKKEVKTLVSMAITEGEGV